MTGSPGKGHPAVVLLERPLDHVALVTLNRPAARNAVDGAMASAIDLLVQRLENDPDIWCVVLTGSGDQAFCAGADLKEVSAGRLDSLWTPRGGFAGFVLSRRSKPWIAAVNGVALAGGLEIALACDMIVAAEGTSFGLPEVTRGMVAAAGGLWRLPRALPRAIALELIATGGRLDIARAAALGLVNRAVPRGQAVRAALELAGQITRNAPIAVRESLDVARQAADLSVDELAGLSAAAQERVRVTEDFREGPLAFIEKRQPRWCGR